MLFTISEGRLFQDGRPVKYVQANAYGKRFKKGAVVAIVHHDTASAKAGSAVSWFANKTNKSASAHVVVEPDGSVVQCVDLRFAAYHAGYSALNGKWTKRTSCNGQTLGIEITNPGVMQRVGDEAQLIYRDQKPSKIVARYPLADCEAYSTKEHGDGWGLPYTPEAIATVIALDRCFVKEHPTIKSLLTHWLVSPGRKYDTTPLFPLEDIRRAVFAPEVTPEMVSPPPPPVAAVSAPQPPAQASMLPPPMGLGMGSEAVDDDDDPIITANEARTALSIGLGGGAVAEGTTKVASTPAPAADVPTMAQLKETADGIGVAQSLGDGAVGLVNIIAANPWMWGLLAAGGIFVGQRYWRRRKRRAALQARAGATAAPQSLPVGEGSVGGAAG